MLFNILICTLGYYGIERYLESNNVKPKNINLYISMIHAITSFLISVCYLSNLLPLNTYIKLNSISRHMLFMIFI